MTIGADKTQKKRLNRGDQACFLFLTLTVVLGVFGWITDGLVLLSPAWQSHSTTLKVISVILSIGAVGYPVMRRARVGAGITPVMLTLFGGIMFSPVTFAAVYEGFPAMVARVSGSEATIDTGIARTQLARIPDRRSIPFEPWLWATLGGKGEPLAVWVKGSGYWGDAIWVSNRIGVPNLRRGKGRYLTTDQRIRITGLETRHATWLVEVVLPDTGVVGVSSNIDPLIPRPMPSRLN